MDEVPRTLSPSDLFGHSGADLPSRRGAARPGAREAHLLEPGLELRADSFDSACCSFLRLTDPRRHFELVVPGSYAVSQCAAGGWLLRPIAGGWAYWLPHGPRARAVNSQGQMLADDDQPPDALEISAERICIVVSAPRKGVLDVVAWRLPDNVAAELAQLTPLESQRYFLWGSHTSYGRPADLYRHLIFGHVYEDRFSWPKYRKICSENDAHALYVLLRGLAAATGKRIYRLLMQQVLLSVLSRQGADGGFRHGEWSDGMEAHFRLHCSAMHLMMDSLADVPSDATREALARAATFLQRARSSIDAGDWFLHDELELTEEAMAASPFRWAHSRVLGKSPGNMLVLNTHLDATIALHRYAALTGDRQYEETVTQALAATRHVLAQRPAEWLYRLFFWPVSLGLLPQVAQAKLPILKRIAKRIGWKYLAPNLYRLKSRWPRFVMPGGYVDRAITLASWSFHYLTVNLMDLVRHQRRLPAPEVATAIEGALRFSHDSGVLARWSELKYERYALGFWAEALVQYCVDHPQAGLEPWLAEATLLLEDLGMGLPPSALGANEEILGKAEQRPCPQPPSAVVRILNLSGRHGSRFLLVNCGAEPAACSVGGLPVTGQAPLPPRGWRLLHSMEADSNEGSMKESVAA